MKGGSTHVINDARIDLGFHEHEFHRFGISTTTANVQERFSESIAGAERIALLVEQVLELGQISLPNRQGRLGGVGLHFLQGGASNGVSGPTASSPRKADPVAAKESLEVLDRAGGGVVLSIQRLGSGNS